MLKLLTYNKEYDKFIEFAFKEMKKSKVEITISLDKHIEWFGTYLGGYFFENANSKGEFGIAVGLPPEKWFPIFVHEYNHFKQHKNNSNKWIALQKYDNLNTEDPILDWINGKLKITSQKAKEMISCYRDMELECEKNTIEDIKKYNLPIDLTYYIKASAAYIHFYNFVYEKKTWSSQGLEPYKIPEIMDLMPETLDVDFSKTEPKIIDLMAKHCVKNEKI